MFRILHDEASGELTYLLADDAARQAVLVDPHGRDLPVLQALLDESDLCLTSRPGSSPGPFAGRVTMCRCSCGRGGVTRYARPRDGWCR